jgi:hypothetical protein
MPMPQDITIDLNLNFLQKNSFSVYYASKNCPKKRGQTWKQGLFSHATTEVSVMITPNDIIK